MPFCILGKAMVQLFTRRWLSMSVCCYQLTDSNTVQRVRVEWHTVHALPEVKTLSRLVRDLMRTFSPGNVSCIG